jgi:hypothetical protein
MASNPTLDPDAKTRVAVAIRLRASGEQWQTIAQQCDYGSPAAAYNAVHRELKRAVVGEVDAWRREECARLDALQRAVWAQATRDYDVELQAVDRVLSIMTMRAKYLGLFVQTSDGAGAVPVKRTYVGVAVDEV